MDTITYILEIIVFVVKLISVIILLVGLFTHLKDLMVGLISKNEVQIQAVKNKLGGIVLLGLEILIIADIVETVINPTFYDIGLLAAVVAIRTIISYFLNKEIREGNSIVEQKNNK